ncbi:hypothetical protein B0T11DRAFT_70921 [Plectosphaerella cucumerina]|uniref:Uncharacterized protein n=1 Tax=Plectosphaerella cucumerina TaxID=40658 RepID=A0A8K0X7Z8_9PEZI|nr:hypothetical protein B0T11DRAFT_70921 [Plectosphaerella cucumerina]
MSGYSSDEDMNIRFTTSRRRASPPGPSYGYAEPARQQRPVQYYPVERPYLAPERTIIRARSRSRERYRYSPPASPPAPAPAPAPVIIHNQIYNDQSDDEDYRKKLQVVRPRRERSRSRGDSRERDTKNYMTREQYEIERARQQLEDMRLAQSRERDRERDRSREAREERERREDRERRQELERVIKHNRDDADLRMAKRELDEIKAREEREKEEARIRKEMELRRLEEERRQKEEKERRDKEAAAAVERYKQEEAERKIKEKKEKELAEKEFQRRLQEQLIHSGLDEKAIEAIIKKEKVPEPPKPKPQHQQPVPNQEIARPTYTRMSRKHLSIETLRTYHIDFDFDQDPEFILIKRWVPEAEQNTLWWHTREIRERRSTGGRLVVDVDSGRRKKKDKDDGFEWVRKKESGSRRRSKSPALLMYLAGAKPA